MPGLLTSPPPGSDLTSLAPPVHPHDVPEREGLSEPPPYNVTQVLEAWQCPPT